MKKLGFILFVAAGMLFGTTACKSKEAAYKAAYLKAQEQPQEVVNEGPEEEVLPADTSVVAPVVNNRVSTERISIIDDNSEKLKPFNVVVGSFSIKTNASSLKERLIADGYDAFLARNNQMMYRVVVGSFDTREEAENLRDAVKAKYSPDFSDAWLLINQ
ncbi:MAG: SPOR domain-containing protein [Porphyromonadaceae bacterium]|nr:SPOR domain-containing protein [Porphyromonadaceae bacterium]